MKENEMVFGIRAVIEAIQADKEVDKILVKRDLQGDLSKELFEVLRGREIPVQRVPAERLESSGGDRFYVGGYLPELGRYHSFCV